MKEFRGLGAATAIVGPWTRISLRADRIASEGEGACLPILRARSHLPLRGKLGWMTPRAAVKTTLASETRLPGLPVPSGGPNFFMVLVCGLVFPIPFAWKFAGAGSRVAIGAILPANAVARRSCSDSCALSGHPQKCVSTSPRKRSLRDTSCGLSGLSSSPVFLLHAVR